MAAGLVLLTVVSFDGVQQYIYILVFWLVFFSRDISLKDSVNVELQQRVLEKGIYLFLRASMMSYMAMF